MFQPVRCPACRAILFECDGAGTIIRKICKCGRVIQIDRQGTVSVLGDRSELRLAGIGT